MRPHGATSPRQHRTTTAALAPVSRTRGLPFYVQVADSIRDLLRAGRWKPGEMIPAEGRLCEMFGVSRTAVRHALAELVSEGLLQKEMGRGTFVTQTQVSLAVQELRGTFAELAAQGRPLQTRVLYAGTVVVPPHVAPRLGILMRSEVVLIERLRLVADEPLVYARTYLPLPRFAKLVDEDLSRSLYAVLDARFDVQPSGGERRVEAVAAEATLAELLGVKARSPLLSVTATDVDGAGAVFEYFEAWYRADRTSFEVVVRASSAAGEAQRTLGHAEGL